VTGKWQLATKAIETLSPKLKEAYRQAQRAYGHRLERIVKGHIVNQDLPWADLAASTVERKGHQDIYQDSMDYYHAIKTHSSGPYKISVGVKAGATNQKGKDIATYAAVNEFGHTFESGRHIPKRALWKPSLDEMGGKQGIAEEVARKFNSLSKLDGTSPYIVVRKTVSNLKTK